MKRKNHYSKHWNKRKLGYGALVSIITILVIAIGLVSWYKISLQPIKSSQVKEFTVKDGQSAEEVINNLQKEGLIKSASALKLNAKLNGSYKDIKVGVYNISTNLSGPEIIQVLTGGKNSNRTLTILPGKTLQEILPDLYSSFGKEEVDSTLSTLESSFHPILASGPKTANLEGYLMPETYTDITEDTNFRDWLKRNLDAHYKAVQPLIPALQAKGFTLHQGLTLASIIQKESDSPNDQKQIAQVFELRLNKQMRLDSDVTFLYAAKLMGVEATPSLNSPYNTRLNTGLPPTPIATFKQSALEAVANPAPGDYLFFVAGDDGIVHFSRTDAEHEQLIQQYCQQGCQ